MEGDGAHPVGILGTKGAPADGGDQSILSMAWDSLLAWSGIVAGEGPWMLLTPCSPPRPAQRTEDELELIFEELLHIKAVAHLSRSVSALCVHPSWAWSPHPPASHHFPSEHPLLPLSEHPCPLPMCVPSLLSSRLG